VPTIDIDRDAAHDAAQRELAKPIYLKASWREQLVGAIEELVYRLGKAGAQIPGGWFTITVLLILLAVGIVVAARIARRTMRTQRSRQPGLFGDHTLSAAEHRATAEQFAGSGDWAAAIRHRLRAVARQLEETGVLEPVPGRTATELARDAGQRLPGLASELSAATAAFNDVTYGGLPGTQASYRLVADLDDHLRSGTAAAPAASDEPRADTGWAAVR